MNRELWADKKHRFYPVPMKNIQQHIPIKKEKKLLMYLKKM